MIDLSEKRTPVGSSPLLAALEREYPAEGSALATMAHTLAEAMSGALRGTDIAALSRELRAILAALDGSSKGRSDTLDELRARRRQRRGRP